MNASLSKSGWCVADPAGGELLVDGCASRETALELAGEVVVLIARGVDGDVARLVGAQLAGAIEEAS